MEDLIAKIHQHADQTLGYWGLIRLARLSLKVSAIAKTQQRIIAHLNKTYED